MLAAKRIRSDASELEIQTLQGILEGALRYSLLAEGASPSSSAALEVIQALPPGKDHSDKFVFVYELAGQMVACSDIICGYPRLDIAYIGLLLVTEAHEGKGVGARVFHHLLSVAHQWRTCSRIRLSVLELNERAHRFWTGFDFNPTGEYQFRIVGQCQQKVILYERLLAPAGSQVIPRNSMIFKDGED